MESDPDWRARSLLELTQREIVSAFVAFSYREARKIHDIIVGPSKTSPTITSMILVENMGSDESFSLNKSIASLLAYVRLPSDLESRGKPYEPTSSDRSTV